MRKVLFVTTISGFLPQFEKNDVKLLGEMGCQVHYASNFRNPVYAFDEKELKSQGIFLHHIDIAKSPVKIRENIAAIRQLRTVIEENDIDIIHCHNPMGGVAGRAAAGTGRRRPYVIYTAHGFHFYKGAPLLNWLLFYPAERFLARFTNQLVTINKEDYVRARGFLLRPGGNTVHIHGVGVNPERFCPDKGTGEKMRKRLGVPRDAFHIVTAAELNANKNQKVIIEAISRLGSKDIYYSICGKGPNEKVLKALVREKHLEKQVRFLGYRTDMEDVLRSADCFAFPSRREGLGVAAIEALLCGVPLIAADNRGTREYAINGINSIVCRPDNVEDFQEAIWLLCKDAGTRIRMADACRVSAGKFTINETGKTMKEVYQKALGSL